MCEQTSDAEGHNAGRAVCGFTNGSPIGVKKPDSSRGMLSHLTAVAEKQKILPKVQGTVVDRRFFFLNQSLLGCIAVDE